MAAASAPRSRRLTWLVALLAALWYPMRRFWAGGSASPAALAKDLTGQVWIVTGANVGIGYETALQLARQNASVVVACRNATRAAGAVAAIRSAAGAGADVTAMNLDLASLTSVRAFAYDALLRFPRISGLVANAGVMMPSPPTRTAEGFELQMGTNHLAHFLLVELLRARLVASAPARVVLVSSRASEQGRLDLGDLNWATRRLNNFQAYADSKLANALHARALAKRLAGTGVTVGSVHPGVVRTELFRSVPLLGAYADTLLAPVTHTFFKSPAEGAQTSLHVALDDSVPAHSGGYFADAALTRNANPQATDDALAEALWTLSERLVGLTD